MQSCTCTRDLASSPGLPRFLFFGFRLLYTEAEEREKRGRPGNTYHVNDVWWTRGGRRGGGGRCPSINSCAIASFLPVKSSTVDLVKLRSPGYR